MDRSRTPVGARRAYAIALLLLVVGVGAWALLRDTTPSSGGDDDGSTERAALVRAVCDDVPPDMMLRTDAYASAGEAVARDAQAFSDAGLADDAQVVRELADLLQRISDANQAQEDTGPLLDEFLVRFHDFGC